MSVTLPKSPENLGLWALEHYAAELHRYLMRRLRDAQSAQDVAQEVYLRLLRVSDAEQVRNYQAYLFSVASNVIREFKIRAHRDRVTYDSEMVEEMADTEAQPGNVGASGEVDAKIQLESLLAQLPPLCRAVLVLHKQEGLSYPEVADRLGITLPTVHRNVFRALALLRKAKW